MVSEVFAGMVLQQSLSWGSGDIWRFVYKSEVAKGKCSKSGRRLTIHYIVL
jgi:hypothetical protein